MNKNIEIKISDMAFNVEPEIFYLIEELKQENKLYKEIVLQFRYAVSVYKDQEMIVEALNLINQYGEILLEDMALRN